MVNNKSIETVWESTMRFTLTFLKSFQKNLNVFTEEYPNTTQSIQLTFVYFFAFIDLVYSILSTVYNLGYYPEFLEKQYPLFRGIIMSPVVRFWASPEKVFFLSYLVLEHMVIRATFKFSKLVKYNILLVFTLLMVQGLVISYWDLLFNSEMIRHSVDLNQAAIEMDQGITLEEISRIIAIVLFLIIFLSFVGMYGYSYWQALDGIFPTLPGFSWLTDSVCFWLRIQTPTMRKRFKK
jgi:nitrate reductase NapE component